MLFTYVCNTFFSTIHIDTPAPIQRAPLSYLVGFPDRTFYRWSAFASHLSISIFASLGYSSMNFLWLKNRLRITFCRIASAADSSVKVPTVPSFSSLNSATYRPSKIPPALACKISLLGGFYSSIRKRTVMLCALNSSIQFLLSLTMSTPATSDRQLG